MIHEFVPRTINKMEISAFYMINLRDKDKVVVPLVI